MIKSMENPGAANGPRNDTGNCRSPYSTVPLADREAQQGRSQSFS